MTRKAQHVRFLLTTSVCYMAYTRYKYVLLGVGLAVAIEHGGRQAGRPFWHIVNYLKMIYCKFVYTLPCGCIAAASCACPAEYFIQQSGVKKEMHQEEENGKPVQQIYRIFI